MIIGVIGLKEKDFEELFNKKDYTKCRNCFKDKHGNEFLYVNDYANVAGRQFDKILDLDQQRIDIVARLRDVDLANYYIGTVNRCFNLINKDNEIARLWEHKKVDAQTIQEQSDLIELLEKALELACEDVWNSDYECIQADYDCWQELVNVYKTKAKEMMKSE